MTFGKFVHFVATPMAIIAQVDEDDIEATMA